MYLCFGKIIVQWCMGSTERFTNFFCIYLAFVWSITQNTQTCIVLICSETLHHSTIPLFLCRAGLAGLFSSQCRGVVSLHCTWGSLRAPASESDSMLHETWITGFPAQAHAPFDWMCEDSETESSPQTQLGRLLLPTMTRRLKKLVFVGKCREFPLVNRSSTWWI